MTTAPARNAFKAARGGARPKWAPLRAAPAGKLAAIQNQALHARSSFPPIGDYGFLSDGEVAALVAPSGNVEWMCVPQFDSPAVFAPILYYMVRHWR